MTSNELTGKQGSDVSALLAQKRRRGRLIILILVIALITAMILSSWIGVTDIPIPVVAKFLLNKILHPTAINVTTQQAIIVDFRAPRIIMAALVGSGLSTAGCALQGLFRNPMADPWALGISSGAAFGASLALLISVSHGSGVEVPFFAFLFAGLTLILLYYLSRTKGMMDTRNLLLVGISLSFFFSALVSVMQYLAGDELRAIAIWLMGTLSRANWRYVGITLPFIVTGSIMIFSLSRQLNIMSVDESTALALGIEVEKVKRKIMIAAAILTGAAVSFNGPIGFIGLIIPHIVRIFTGPDHRILLPASAITGAIFLIGTDTFARSMMNEIPVGIITAIMGCPFFIYLVRKRRQSGGYA